MSEELMKDVELLASHQRVAALQTKLDEANARLAMLSEALGKAFAEINEIHARDGIPYKACGMKSSVTQEYFTSVVDECSQALNANKEYVEAWLTDKELEQYELGYNAGKAIIEQQLATVTQERDALRVLAAGARIPHHIMCNAVQPTKEPWVCNCGAEERQERLDKALTQKGGES